MMSKDYPGKTGINAKLKACLTAVRADRFKVYPT